MKSTDLRVGLVALAALLSACEKADVPSNSLPQGNVAVFSLGFGLVPAPNDLLGFTSVDDTLDLPNDDDLDPIASINSIDGWSTSAHLDVSFFRALDPATLSLGPTGSIRLFEVTLEEVPGEVGGQVTEVVAELDPATGSGPAMDAVLAEEDILARTMRLRVTRPLKPETGYMLLLTDSITDVAGVPAERSIEFDFLAGEPIDPNDESIGELAEVQPFVQSMLTEAVAFDPALDPDTVVLALSFSTQSVTPVANALREIAQGSEAGVIAALQAAGDVDVDSTTPDPNGTANFGSFSLIGSTGTLIGSGDDFADIYQGSVTLPYYLASPANSTDDSLLHEFMEARYSRVTSDGSADADRNLTRFNPLPQVRSTQTIPVLVAVPNANSGAVQPASGWPVAIFQHGITGNRFDIVDVADSIVEAGIVAVAIDIPLHGIDSSDADYGAFSVGYAYDGSLSERTWGVDLSDSNGDEGSDGEVDGSGTHIINLSSLRTSRDNLRQAIADLCAVLYSLDQLDYDGGGVDVDVENAHFAGGSLGGIIGTGFCAIVAIDPDPPATLSDPSTVLNTATLAVPGAGIPKLLIGSGSFGFALKLGLAQAFDEDLNVSDIPALIEVLSDPEFRDFVQSFAFSAQTAVDSVDPINLGPLLAASDLPVFLLEVIGDDVVPNDVLDPVEQVPDAPLAGTEPLIAAMGLDIITGSVSDPAGLKAAVRFLPPAEHGSLLDSDASPAATEEMRAQIKSFILSNGTSITVSNSAVIQTTP